jgi:hypothetical protein
MIAYWLNITTLIEDKIKMPPLHIYVEGELDVKDDTTFEFLEQLGLR